MGRQKTKNKTAGRSHQYEVIASYDGDALHCVCDDFGTGIFIVSRIGGVNMWNRWKTFMKDERGITSVEIILILVILIGLVLIFKEQMTDLVNNIFKTITSQSGKILK